MTTATRTISKFFFRSYTLKSHSSAISRLSSTASLNASHKISPIARGLATGVNSNRDSWSTNPTYEKNLEIGRDLEHWLVVVNRPVGFREQKIDSYIKTLATVIGSEDEARMKIYSVSTEHHYAFGALVSEELANKLRELPNVRVVFPDSYLNKKNKDYGGEPFINGQALPIKRNSRRREYLEMNQLVGSPGDMRCPHCNLAVELPGNTGGPSGDMGGFPPARGSGPDIGAIPPNNMRGMHGIMLEGCNKITLGVSQIWGRCKTATWDTWKVLSGTGKK